MSYYIYILQNKINNKIYVGQTNNLAKRKREHKAKDRLKTKGTPLYCAIAKYGFENFEMIEIEKFDNINDVNEAEEFWIQFFQTTNRDIGYNLAKGGLVNRGYKHSDEFKKQKSKQMKEFYKTNKPANYGQPMTEEAKNNLSNLWAGEKAINAKFTNEQIKNIRNDFLTLEFTITSLAKKYSSSVSSMEDIVHNKTYKDEKYILTEDFILKQKKYSIQKSTEHSKKSIKDDKGNIFSSIKDAASFYDIKNQTIIKILKGERKGRDRKKYWFYYL